MKILSIDIETYCDLNLSKCGVYAYSDSPSFEILLFAYAFDDEDVKIVDLARGEKLPQKVIDALFDENIIKTAFNASFERICISKYLNKQLSPKSWHCSAVKSAMLSLPPTLEGVGKILKIKEQKLKEGKDLIRYFSMPCKPTKSNQGRSRNLPEDDLDKWEDFKKYCIRDVNAEREIRKKLSRFQIPNEEVEMYIIDQEINDRGILVDKILVNQAIECDNKYKEIIMKKAEELSGMTNPNSLTQMKNYLLENNIKAKRLDRKSVEKLISESEGDVNEVLKLRLLMSKTSIKKYEAIKRSISSDDRVHGLLQFYGASRTGRWAGRLVQVQNLPQNHTKDLEVARNLLKSGKYQELEILYGSTPNILSELIRTAFIPKKGHEFIVVDFSAIEARVLAWIAKEQWRMRVFETNGKIYEASAAIMSGVPIREITKGSDLRKQGKLAELSLGYGGSCGALISMGALEMGIKETKLKSLVNSWRKVNPHITKFWWDVDRAAIKTISEGVAEGVGPIRFNMAGEILFITLPSGRKLSYIKPQLQENKFGKLGMTYEGIDSKKKWSRIETYGPKLVENIVQGISRDILAYAMKNLRNSGFDIVMHVHDEVVIEVPKDKVTVEEVCNIMTKVPPWARGLPLRAEGYKCDFYKKD